MLVAGCLGIQGYIVSNIDRGGNLYLVLYDGYKVCGSSEIQTVDDISRTVSEC